MNNKIISAVLVSACALYACQSELETVYNNQESRIDSYISSHSVVGEDTLRVVHNSGSNRLVITEGQGEELSASGTVSFYYAGYVFSGSLSNANLFATNHEDTAAAANWSLEGQDFTPVTINMAETKKTLLQGLANGLIGVKGGEEAEILFSGKYGFGNKAYGNIPAKSALAYKIWVVAVSNE